MVIFVNKEINLTNCQTRYHLWINKKTALVHNLCTIVHKLSWCHAVVMLLLLSCCCHAFAGCCCCQTAASAAAAIVYQLHHKPHTIAHFCMCLLACIYFLTIIDALLKVDSQSRLLKFPTNFEDKR